MLRRRTGMPCSRQNERSTRRPMSSLAPAQRNGSTGSARTRTRSPSRSSRAAMPSATASVSTADADPRSITSSHALSPTEEGLMIVAMPQKLLIVLANTDPRNHEELGSPFFQAAVAAAMDFAVEVICTAAAGRLMKCGVAETLTVKPGSDKSVYDFIKDAHGLGAKFYACAGNLELFDMDQSDLIPECAGIVGTAYLIDRVMSDEYRVLSY